MAVTKAQYSAQSAELITQRLNNSITEAQFKTQWADLNNEYGVSNPELADRQGKFIDESQDLKKGIYDWATGTVTGGPNHDGTYPIRLVTGGTVFWPCIARIIDPLYGSETLAKEYAERAEAALASFLENTDNSAESAAAAKASELAAKASELAAAASASGVNTVKVAAEAARDQALAAKTAAETAKAAAETARDNAAGSATAAHNSEVAAAASAGQVLDAADEATEQAQAAATSAAQALQSKQDAQSAATSANASKGAAEASESAAALSEDNAHNSELAAKASELAAQASKIAAEAAQAAAALSATDLDTAKTAAEAAQTAAEAAQLAAEAARDAASLVQADVTSSKVAAQNAATSAASSKTAAENARDTAITKAAEADASADAAALSALTANNNTATIGEWVETAGLYRQQSIDAALESKGYRDAAEAAKVAAEAAKVAAQTAKTASESARDTAVTKAGEAAQSATDAATSRSFASASASTAQSWAGQAHGASTVASDAADAAIAAANDAEDAQAITEDARDDAVAAKIAAEAAAQQAAETVGFDINDYQLLSAKGQPNGYASLDATGKVPLSQLDTAVLGGLNYQGTWDAATNTPAIPAAATGNKSQYFIVSVSGATTINGVTDWQAGDLIMSNGQFWHKLDQTNLILSVNGQTGAVVLAKADVGLGNADNTSDANKPVSTATQAALNLKLDVASKATSTDATTGTDDAKYMTAAKTKAAINGAAITVTQVTNLTETLVLKLDASEKGVANGLASLDANGKVPAAQLDLTWGAISGKPTVFTPDVHTHVLADITDFNSWASSNVSAKFLNYQARNEKNQQNGYAGLDASGWVPLNNLPLNNLGPQIGVPWSNVLSRPSTFTPSAHVHAISDVTGLQTALDAKVSTSGAVLSVASRTGNVVLTKSDVGLANVDNTTDANKPVSTATQTALDAKLAISSKATAGEATAGADDTKYMTPAKTASAIGAATITQAQVSGLSTALAGKVADGDALKSDRQVIVTPSIVGGVLTLDLSLGSAFNVSWDANITSIVVSNAPSGMVSWTLVLVGAGGLSVSWNTTTFKFPGGTAPTLINTTGAHNFMSMATLNAGTRVNVFFSGATV